MDMFINLELMGLDFVLKVTTADEVDSNDFERAIFEK